MLKKQSKTEQKSNSAKGIAPTVKRIWAYLADQRSLLIFVLLMVVASSALGLLGPFLIGWGIDEYFATESTDGFIWLLVGLGVVYALHSLSLWLQSYWMIGIAQKTVYTMRKQLFTHFHKLSIDFFNKRQHGELMSRVTNDIENVSATLNSSVIQIFFKCAYPGGNPSRHDLAEPIAHACHDDYCAADVHGNEVDYEPDREAVQRTAAPAW